MKTCAYCGETKPLEFFPTCGRKCKACRSKDGARRYAENGDAIRAQHRAYWAANKDKLAATRASYRASHREEISENATEYYKTNRKLIRWRQHGLSAEDISRILELQGNLCPVCLEGLPDEAGYAIDHDHRCCEGRTGCRLCVRGILHKTCNSGMGMMRDDPALLGRAIEYLSRDGTPWRDDPSNDHD